jgi:hypothetical protein
MDGATADKLAEARRRRALAAFRATLPPEGSELEVCQPGCDRDHDAERAAALARREAQEPAGAGRASGLR